MKMYGKQIIEGLEKQAKFRAFLESNEGTERF
jgi:hypothetical protein